MANAILRGISHEDYTLMPKRVLEDDWGDKGSRVRTTFCTSRHKALSAFTDRAANPNNIVVDGAYNGVSTDPDAIWPDNANELLGREVVSLRVSCGPRGLERRVIIAEEACGAAIQDVSIQDVSGSSNSEVKR